MLRTDIVRSQGDIVRITDLSLPTPVTAARPSSSRRAGAEAAPNIVASVAREAGHPDEVAATALARAAGQAHAGRVVAAANQTASESVRGDRLTTELVP
jgi:hypothetical protein